MKKLAIFFIVVLIGAAAAIIYAGKVEVTPGETAIVVIGKCERLIKGPGRIEGLGEIPLSFGMPGRLDQNFAQDGKEVALNEEIAVLNSADMDNQVKQAEDALNEAQAQLDAAKAAYAPEVIAGATAKFDQAAADVKAAESHLKALQSPIIAEQTPQWQLDDAARAIEDAKIKMEQADNKLKRLKAGPNPDDVAVATAELNAAENQLRLAIKRLDGFREGGAIFGPKEDKAKVEDEVERARQAVALARVKYDKANRPAKPEDIRAAELEVALAKNVVASAEAAKARLEKPEPPKQTPQHDIDQAQAVLDKAKAEENGRKAELDALKRGPDPLKVKVAEAALKRATTQLEQKKLYREGLRLRAPKDGLIIKRMAESGMMLAPNQPVAVMMDFSEKRVRAEFDIGRMSDIKPGMPVIIRTRALKEPLEGKVLDLGRVGMRKLFSDDPNAPRGGEVVEAVIALPEPKAGLKLESFKLLKPNMTVDAEIVVERKENVLVVPKTYVSQEDGHEYVQKLDPNPASGANQAPKRSDVKTGMRDEYFVEVVSGLSEGDKVMKPRAANANK